MTMSRGGADFEWRGSGDKHACIVSAYAGYAPRELVILLPHGFLDSTQLIVPHTIAFLYYLIANFSL